MSHGRWLVSHRLGQDLFPHLPQRLHSGRLLTRDICRAQERKHCPLHSQGWAPAAGQALDLVLDQKMCLFCPHLKEVWLETLHQVLAAPQALRSADKERLLMSTRSQAQP